MAGVRTVAGQETDLRAGNDAVLSSRGGVGAARDKTALVERDGGVLVEGERRESLWWHTRLRYILEYYEYGATYRKILQLRASNSTSRTEHQRCTGRVCVRPGGIVSRKSEVGEGVERATTETIAPRARSTLGSRECRGDSRKSGSEEAERKHGGGVKEVKGKERRG